MSVFSDWHFVCRYELAGQAGNDGERIAEDVIPDPIGNLMTWNNKQNKFNMIRPLADRVVIEPKAAETQTASGLYIPDTAKEKPQQGTVVAAGPGKKDEPMEVKVGDVVIYGKYAGTEVSVEGKDYLIMKQSDILAIL